MDDLDSVDRAIAALQAQRAILGDDVVDTALRPLQERRAAQRAAATGEQRKLVTVLFADLVDFTAMSRSRDAEDTRAIVNAYFLAWNRCIEARGGVVEKFIGDAVMAVFGLHRAAEDDPQQAIRAALDMGRALTDLNQRLETEHGISLQMRVGIDTGDVVVSTLGERPGQDFVVVGDTVNRASRLQSAAAAGGVLISRATLQHVRGIFALQPMLGLRLKGIDDPVDAYLILGERPHSFRLDGARGVEGVETSTVGRDIQLRQTQDLFWEVVEEDRWRLLTVVGDAGVGKSRLLLEFDTWLAELPDGVWWFRGRASSSGQNLPGALLRDALSARFGIHDSDPPQAVRAKCEAGFEAVLGDGEPTRRAAHAVCAWLGFELGDDDLAAGLRHDPQVLREVGTARLAEYFAKLTEQAPVVILLEDLHWADDASLAWLDAADAVLARVPALVVATARPTLLERRPHWGEGLAHHARLDLGPLSRRESRQLLREILSHCDEVPDTLIDRLVDVAEGNPFYIEELVKWLLEAGVIVRETTEGGEVWHVSEQLVDATQAPPTLKGVLQARLDALSAAERAVVQRAAVIGRVFWDDAVEQLMGDSAPTGADTSAALTRLRSREVVYQHQNSSFEETREFLFKHALLRDVAYDSIVRTRRRTYHGLAARWLEQVTERTRRTDEYAGLIAEHYDRSRDPAAAGWYLRAARQAADVHALDDALRLLQRGLEVVTDDPVLRFDLLLRRESVLDRVGERSAQAADLEALQGLEPEVDPRRRVRLMTARARLLFNSSEYDEQGVIAAAGAELARENGLLAEEAESYLWWGKGLTWDHQADQARQVLGRALDASRRAGDHRTVGETLRYLSIVANNLEEYPESLDLLAQAREVYERENDVEGISAIAGQQAAVLHNLGRYEEAEEALLQAIPIYRMSGYRYREAVALGNLATIQLSLGKLGSSHRLGLEALELTLRLGDKEAINTTLDHLGVLAFTVGDLDSAQEHFERALAGAEELGFRLLQSDALGYLALIALERGDLETARARAERATEVARDTDLSLLVAYAGLVTGQVDIATGDLDGAEVVFESAMKTFADVGQAGQEAECRAGLARVALARGDVDRAVPLVEPLLPRLDAHGLAGAIRVGTVLVTCWDVLSAAGDPRTSAVLATARAYLDHRAALIDDDEMRAAFLATPAIARLLSLDPT